MLCDTNKKGKVMKKLYICHTVYQLLITLLKLEEDCDNEILLVDDVIEESVKDKINFYRLAKLRDISSNIFGFKHLWKKKHLDRYEIYFKSFDTIYIFLDHRQIGAFLQWRKIPYKLLEDGFNFFRFKLLNDPMRIYSSGLLEWLYNVITGRSVYAGASPFCQEIEVNSLENLAISDERLHKMIAVSRRKLFDSLSIERKSQLLDIFKVPEVLSTEKSVLILTQPLYEIAHFGIDKIAQKSLFTELCQRYSKDYIVYFKKHPRDKVDYSDIDYVVNLDPSIPIEIFELNKFRFSKGIAHSSTALDYLSCVDEKIMLYHNNEVI